MVAIIMSTYNGENYLPEQLDSLLEQTYNKFVVHVQDDASTDKTWAILTEYHVRYPDKFRICQRNSNSGSPKYNFLELMAKVQEDYVMFCDQDDVWLPNKIAVTLNKVQSMETDYPDTPILVYTDLRVVDKDLQLINPSYRHMMNSDFTRNAPNQVLVQATFAGCSSMYNRKLAELLTTMPDYCVMHDWWVHLVATVFGEVGYLEETTALYRQHGANQTGVRDMRKIAYKLLWFLKGKEIREAIQSTYKQAESFLKMYENVMSLNSKELVQNYCEIPRKNKLARWFTVCRLGAYKIGFARNVAYFLWL